MLGFKKKERDDNERFITFKNDLTKNDPLAAIPISEYRIAWIDDKGVPIDDDWLEAHVLACPALDRTSGEYLDPDLVGIAGRRMAELKAQTDGGTGHVGQIALPESHEGARVRELRGSIDAILVELEGRYKKLKAIQEDKI